MQQQGTHCLFGACCSCSCNFLCQCMQQQGTHCLFGACCSCSCNFLCQWDMARAVPRKVNEVKLFTGDIQGLRTGRDKVFACTSKGAIRYCSSSLQFLFSSFSYIHLGLADDCLLTTSDLYASDPLFGLLFKQTVSSFFCVVSPQAICHRKLLSFLKYLLTCTIIRATEKSQPQKCLETGETRLTHFYIGQIYQDTSLHPSNNQGPVCSTLAASQIFYVFAGPGTLARRVSYPRQAPGRKPTRTE